MERTGNDFRDACRIVNLGGPLGSLSENRAVVHFLKGLALAHATLNLAHKHNHGCGVLLGNVNASQCI